jgi:polyisoprenoid-binding protein YceI
MLLRRTAPLVVALLVASSAMAAETYTFDKNHTEVSFQIRHFVSKVRGRFTDFSGTIQVDKAKPEASSVDFKIMTTSIDTASEGRDKHLRSADFFDAEKFPEITFKSSKVVAKAEKDTYAVTGTLTMHGVSKEVTLPIAYLGGVATKERDGRAGEKLGFETSLTLNRKDYGVVWNVALDTGGYMLGDDVLVSINVEANKQLPPAPPAPTPAK